jgi:hypothetical protein
MQQAFVDVLEVLFLAMSKVVVLVEAQHSILIAF